MPISVELRAEMMKVEFHRLTANDLNEAISHYESEKPGLGQELRVEVYRAVDKIAENPFMYPEIRNGIRRCAIHRFPFSILFKILEGDLVRVLVIRHHRRRPAFGSRRQ